MKQLNTHINFMGMRRPAVFLSGALIFISLAMLLFRGLELGVDFTGGTVMELSYPSAVEPTEIKILLEKEGFEDLTVQHFGSIEKVLIRIAPQKKQEAEKEVEKEPVEKQDKKSVLSNKVLQVLQTQVAGVKIDRVEFVGPQIGEELREQGGLAMLYALIGILIYITLRFEFRFSVGAIVALIHDVVITLGFFAITRVEFDLTVLAAILAIIGYSLNDTIVVFDRVRENFTVLRKKEPEEILNTSVNQTLSRTIVTSLTTLLVLLALYFVGGEAVHAFAAAMIVGVIVGTYSSIYVANSSLLMMGIDKEAFMPVEKENDDELMNMP
jgi:preprotein translocase subunit SecF